ncbi:MAG TPA: hypothetical protein VNO75_06865 [Gemmatimonadaceae bacterium]|nr:hypothetical protein [Gemmatimonadaceae bacterium]
MTRVQILIGRTRSMMRKAAVVLAATQMVIGGAPFAESGSRSATAHVEAAGVQLHHAHAEELCIACAALKVVGGAAPSDTHSFVALDSSAPPADSAQSFDPRLANGPQRSRAPPVLLG